MGLSVRTFETLAQRIAKFTKLEEKASVLFTKPQLLDSIKPTELKLAPLKTDVIELSQKSIEVKPTPKFKILATKPGDPILLKIKEFFDAPTPEKLMQTQKLFEELTGIALHVPFTNRISAFNPSVVEVLNQVKSNTFPKDIRHLVIGHGHGLSLNGTWRFQTDGILKNEPKVFDYISRNIPKDEKVLLATCEVSNVRIPNKPGIGNVCTTHLANPDNPGKIVKSGQNKIIGHFVNAEATYY